MWCPIEVFSLLGTMLNDQYALFVFNSKSQTHAEYLLDQSFLYSSWILGKDLYENFEERKISTL